MITILCSGSRGDVQPYIALAQELAKLGLPSRIATSRMFEGLVRGYGIGFHSIEVDYESAGVDPEVIRKAQKADSLLKMLSSFRALSEYGRHMAEQYHDACLDSEAIVFHPGLSVGYFMAERLGVPAVLASPFPLHRTRLRPSVALYGKTIPNGLINTMSYRALQGMLWMASESSLKAFWKTRYGGLPESFGMPFERHRDARHPALVSCSNHIFSRPEDWNPHVHQRGYWFVEEAEEFEPDPELAAFLAAGEKPVYVGFGSMLDGAASPHEAARLGRIVIEALALAGKRGILSGLAAPGPLAEGILAVGNVPHGWLFPRMAAVCHHGGAGTSASGFSAGVPSIIDPFALDQFAWAQRSHELGVGTRPLPFKRLSAERLAGAIRAATSPELQARARDLARDIATEEGARDCARVIARTMETAADAKR